MPAQTAKNLHVPLPDSTYARLRREADRTRRPATELAREAILEWLDKQRLAETHEAVAEYARTVAGTVDDLDPDLEAAGVDQLRELDSNSEQLSGNETR